ncbi:hypothetical protein DFJ77DRAFT_224057 [Powellomyces hirtus]|nr:hypothetical protein DFJ77DRAFT_224057 [Powellomyces hirtus]
MISAYDDQPQQGQQPRNGTVPSAEERAVLLSQISAERSRIRDEQLNLMRAHARLADLERQAMQTPPFDEPSFGNSTLSSYIPPPVAPAAAPTQAPSFPQYPSTAYYTAPSTPNYLQPQQPQQQQQQALPPPPQQQQHQPHQQQYQEAPQPQHHQPPQQQQNQFLYRQSYVTPLVTPTDTTSGQSPLSAGGLVGTMQASENNLNTRLNPDLFDMQQGLFDMSIHRPHQPLPQPQPQSHQLQQPHSSLHQPSRHHHEQSRPQQVQQHQQHSYQQQPQQHHHHHQPRQQPPQSQPQLWNGTQDWNGGQRRTNTYSPDLLPLDGSSSYNDNLPQEHLAQNNLSNHNSQHNDWGSSFAMYPPLAPAIEDFGQADQQSTLLGSFGTQQYRSDSESSVSLSPAMDYSRGNFSGHAPANNSLQHFDNGSPQMTVGPDSASSNSSAAASMQFPPMIPPSASQQAPVRNSKKTTIDHLTKCNVCGKDLAYLVLSGSADSPPPSLILTCTPCTDPSSYSDALVNKTKRKQSITSTIMSCQACKNTIGLAVPGEMPPIPIKMHAAGHHDRETALLLMNNGLHSAMNTNLDMEAVCMPCWNKYSFCTECGGGGTYRTGKYRPRELFQSGRRTCSLPHIRIGRSNRVKYTYEAWDIDNMDPNLRAIRCEQVCQFFVDTATKLIACAQVMEHTEGLATWADVDRRRQNSREELQKLIESPPLESVRKFLAIAWMPVPGPRSKRSEQASAAAAATRSANSSSSTSPPLTTSAAPTHTIAAIVTGRYTPATGVLEQSYSACMNNTPKGPSLELFAALWNTLPSPPHWVYYLARKQTGLAPRFARQNGIKFRTIPEWAKRGRDVHPWMFDKTLLPADVRDCFETFVADTNDVKAAVEALREREKWPKLPESHHVR